MGFRSVFIAIVIATGLIVSAYMVNSHRPAPLLTSRARHSSELPAGVRSAILICSTRLFMSTN